MKRNKASDVPSNYITIIGVLTIMLHAVTLTESLYFPESTALNKLRNIHDAKQLRSDLINFQTSVDELIKRLDDWALIEVKHVTNNKELTEIKMIWLEREMNKCKTNIKQLSMDLSNNVYNISEVYKKFANIQSNLHKFSDHLDENTRETLRLLNDYFSNTKLNLVETHDSLMYQIDVLHRQIVAKEKELLVEDCIESVRKKEFENGADKLEIINDDNKINFIIREVYNSTEDNFELILKFGDKIRNTTKSFLVYRVLIYEMEINKHNVDPGKMIEVIRSLRSEIIFQLKTIPSIKNEALALEEYLFKKLKTLIKESLKKTILDYKYNFNIPIFEQILLLDEKIFSELCTNTLLEFYKNKESLFDWIMEAFTNIFSTLFNKNLNDKTVFKLAYFIDYLNVSSNLLGVKRFSKKVMDQMEPFKNRLPISVKNIVFTKQVCIKNLGLNEYLQSTSKTVDDIKYGVHTNKFNNTNKLIDIKWLFTRAHGTVYSVQNVAQSFAYLYTSDIDDTDVNKSDGHNIYTWLPRHDELLKLAIWQLEPVDDYVYIKNILHNEYLFESDKNSHIPITISNFNRNNNYWKWHVTNC